MNIKKHIPNFLTCCNLLCGCLGIHATFYSFEYGDLTLASYYIFAACIFDFLDGFIARILKVTSPIGKELDSLADAVTFGVLPAAIIYKLLDLYFTSPFSRMYLIRPDLHTNWVLPLPNQSFDRITFWIDNHLYFEIGAILIAIFSALRLAKFNIDTRQSESFIGVPTPTNAILVASFPLILAGEPSFISNLVGNPIFLIAYSIIMSLLLVAELPLFALKFKNFSWADNQMKYILLASSFVLLILLQWDAIPLIIFLYIILSVIENKVLKPKV